MTLLYYAVWKAKGYNATSIFFIGGFLEILSIIRRNELGEGRLLTDKQLVHQTCHVSKGACNSCVMILIILFYVNSVILDTIDSTQKHHNEHPLWFRNTWMQQNPRDNKKMYRLLYTLEREKPNWRTKISIKEKSLVRRNPFENLQFSTITVYIIVIERRKPQ